MSAAEVIAQSLEGHWGSAAPRQRVQECCTTAVLDDLKAAGYAVVELPKPQPEPYTEHDLWQFKTDAGDLVRVRWSKEIVLDGGGYNADEARAVAAALLAAAELSAVTE